ncbi:MAG: ATP-binding protein [Crocinitomicaceae bacterium]|nr:ATP-binding protein [Crocinitomicaceae bacterium]
MKRRTELILYVLSIYVILQFCWWGYHLIELTKEAGTESYKINRRVTMIMGEGSVFLLILIIGIWQIRKSIKKDIELSERQNNFLLSVTHELKTPLAANRLYIQTILKRNLNKKQFDELLVKANEENDRLERMIDNILNASRLENKALQLNREKFDFHQLCASSIERFKQLSPQTSFILDANEKTLVSGDQLLIETILSNLVENSVKYAGNDSEVTIYAKVGSGSFVFGVKDNGSGVKLEDQEKIFSKFYRSGNEDTRTQKGSGLGLYIVRELVRLHRGKINYKNNSPQGADFQIELRND